MPRVPAGNLGCLSASRRWSKKDKNFPVLPGLESEDAARLAAN